MSTEEPLIIKYTNLLHQYRDTNAPAVKDFVAQHADDPVFQSRAKVLNRLFKLKESLITSRDTKRKPGDSGVFSIFC